MSSSLVFIFATACGLAAANLYYSQPLLDVLGREFGIGQARAGLIVTITQLGYAIGLLVLAPLGDLLENRRLILTLFSCCVAALLIATSAPNFVAFLAASFTLGFTSVVTQIIVPLAASLAPAERRGHIVGTVTGGLLMGILLARAISGLISGPFGWRAVYWFAACATAAMIVILRVRLPQRRAGFQQGYFALLKSLIDVVRTQPPLRRRCIYQASLMGSFSTFWTGITFVLSAPPYNFTPPQIGLFALAGAIGAMFASVAGKLADKGHTRFGTGAALLTGVLSFCFSLWTGHLLVLAATAILVDLAVNTNLVMGHHTIQSLDASARSRLNTVYISSFLFGAAFASSLTGLAYARGGWPWVVAIGAGMPALAFLYWLTEPAPPLTAQRLSSQTPSAR